MSGGRFRRGIQRANMPTKQDMIESFDARLKALSEAMQQIHMMSMRQGQQISKRMAEMASELEIADYRSLATMEMLAEKGVLTTDAHSAFVEVLKIKDFNEQSEKDDIMRKLMPVGGPVALGQFATLRLWATYGSTLEVPNIKKPVALVGESGQTEEVPTVKETIPNPKAGQPVNELSILRSKVQVGSGHLHALLEQQFVGMNVGETKEFSLTLPQEFGPLGGQTVNFKVELLDLKQAPEAPKAAEAPKTEEEPKTTNAEKEPS